MNELAQNLTEFVKGQTLSASFILGIYIQRQNVEIATILAVVVFVSHQLICLSREVYCE